MHERNINISDSSLGISDEELLSDSEENPLIDEVSIVEHRRKSTPNMFSFGKKKISNKLLTLLIIFIVLLSIHILIINNVKSYSRREVPGWSKNTSRETSDYILPNENTTLIEPGLLCRETDPVFLLIVVCSSASNFEARQTIRETWGNTSEFNYPMFEKFHGLHNGSFLNINNKHWHKYAENSSSSQPLNLSALRTRVVFLLGVSPNEATSDEMQYQLNYEHDVYGDIIQENFIDSYNNLTLKTILMLKWTSNNCVNKVKYIMKCDDDTFVNVPNLIHVLLGGTVPVYKSTIPFYDKISVNARNNRNRVIESKYMLMGYKFCSAKPVTDVSSKWYAPNYMYSGEFYPDYLSGSSYVMTFETAQRMYKGSLSTTLFYLEDVYLTGFVADKIRQKRQHHPLFYYLSTKDHCSLRGMITQHQLTPMNMEIAYSIVKNLTINCPVPGKNFMSTKLKLTLRKRCQ